MIIRNKFNGYINGNNRLYPGGGGGPSSSTSYQTNIPEYARPYVESMLGATQKQIFTGTGSGKDFKPTGFNPYTPYGSTYEQDQTGAPLKDASGNIMYTNTARQQAEAAVAPQSYGQQAATFNVNNYVNPNQTLSASQMMSDLTGRSAASGYYSPMQAERFQLGAPQQVRSDSFTAPGVSQAYMSPYMQNVVNAQQREARRAGEIQRNQNQAQAVQQGAFGGSRQGIVEAERQRNLATQLGDIQAQGLQGAYQQGMGQFNAEQNAYLQAQQANQQANLQAGTTNLQAQQEAQRQQEASRQFGANLGLQGYNQAGQLAGQLGQLGQQEYNQEMGRIQAMSDLGAKEQAQEQAVINQQLQNYATQQQYPFMQLGIMSNMLRGLPMQAGTTSMYQAQPMGIQQAVGMAGALASMGRKKGGVIKMAGGGVTGVDPNKLQGMAEKLTDEQLQQQVASNQNNPLPLGIMQNVIANRADIRSRASAMPKAANGGVVALAKGGSDFYEQYKKDVAPAIAEASKEDESETALKASLKREMETVNKTPKEIIDQQKEFYTAAGVPTDITKKLRETYTKQLDNMASETEEQRNLRKAQAWAIFGSTPGPLLKVGLQAMQGYIESDIEDTKQRKKMLNDLNKSIFELDQADYLEKAGQAKEGMAYRKDSWNRIDGINEKLATVNQRRKSDVLSATTKGAETAVQARAKVQGEEIQARSRAASDQKYLDRQVEADKKRADMHTRAARAELQKFDNDKERRQQASTAEQILASNADEETKAGQRKILAGIKAERDALRRSLPNSYPDARLDQLEEDNKAQTATNNKVVKWDDIK
jgi:hypothetical protein